MPLLTACNVVHISYMIHTMYYTDTYNVLYRKLYDTRYVVYGARAPLAAEGALVSGFAVYTYPSCGVSSYPYICNITNIIYIYTFPKGRHNSTCLARGYYETIRRFVDRVLVTVCAL